MRLALMTTILLTVSPALAGCGGSGHHSARATSPIGGRQPGPVAARAAARTFLKGWLLYEYGHAKAAVMKDATPTFTTVLADYPPDIPPASTSRHLYGRLVSLSMVRRGSTWRGLAHITDGQETFDEIVQVIQTGGRWLVDLIIPPP